MSETLFTLEFTELGKEDSDPFCNCIAMCVPRIGETVSLYLVTHQGYQSFTVVKVDYLLDCRNGHGKSPSHWGMQSVSLTVEKL